MTLGLSWSLGEGLQGWRRTEPLLAHVGPRLPRAKPRLQTKEERSGIRPETHGSEGILIGQCDVEPLVLAQDHSPCRGWEQHPRYKRAGHAAEAGLASRSGGVVLGVSQTRGSPNPSSYLGSGCLWLPRPSKPAVMLGASLPTSGSLGGLRQRTPHSSTSSGIPTVTSGTA